MESDKEGSDNEDDELMEDLDNQEDSGDQGDGEEQEDEEDTMTGIESHQVNRQSTPTLAIEIWTPRGDTPTLEIGSDGRPVSKKRRITESNAFRSFNVGFTK
jgi:hypothetical protein